MKLGIYGAGGLGQEIYEVSKRINSASKRWKEIFFVDDVRSEGPIFGARSTKFERLLDDKNEYELIVAVGEPSLREKLFNKAKENNFKIVNLIDPTALVSPSARLAEGIIICQFASVNAGTIIHENVLIQPYCIVGHDITIGSHSVLSPHSTPGGNSVFGSRVFVGMNSSIKEKLIIGNDVVIGMGAAVFNDLPDNVTVVGNPARVTLARENRKVF
jgi:sugar O-acyltransferase (sialic acid O-acetyltransferase NeuD family)